VLIVYFFNIMIMLVIYFKTLILLCIFETDRYM